MIVDAESPGRDTLEHLALVSASNRGRWWCSPKTRAMEPMRQALKAGVSAYVIAGSAPQRLMPVLQVAIARFEQERELREQLDAAQTRTRRTQARSNAPRAC